MPTGQTHRLLSHLRQAALLRDGGGLTDGQLLGCFIERRDEGAFTALVRRHGPMVLGVCRRVLRHEQDAEDAFQATFLVLARKAASLRSRELVGNWLYGTAYRTALEARATIARRQAREKQVENMPDPQVEAEAAWRELRPVLDRELSRLPDKYRVPVVLCDLEGRSRKEVARQLRVPEGTVSSRLATARKLLARRLARYGLAVSGGALAALLAENGSAAGVPRVLLVAAGQAGAVSARVMALTEGVVKTMLLTKLKTVGAVVLAVFVSAGAVGLSFQTRAQEPKQVSTDQPRQVGAAPKADRAAPDELEEMRLEIEALRRGLQATRERVKTLEAEVQALKGRDGASPQSGDKRSDFNSNAYQKGPYYYKAGEPGPKQETGPDLKSAQPKGKDLRFDQVYRELQRKDRPRGADDPLAEAEAALKKLRQDPGDKQAADALERAFQRLKERPKTGTIYEKEKREVR
jgi:RNA polymerase sigma factor (sigma-70 family)